MNENYATWRMCGFAIAVFQVLMLIGNLCSDSVSRKVIYYRWHYILLIAATLVAELLLYVFKRQEQMVTQFYLVMWGYVLALFIWAIGITYVGFASNEDLSTFAYVTITTCAIVLIEPWRIILVLSISTACLGVILFSNPALEADFGTIIQMMSIFALAVVVSIIAYNRRLNRVRLEYEHMDDLEEIRELNVKLQNDAVMDALTGLYNRRYLTAHIDEPLNTGVYPSGLMMIDIDSFKRINDTCGHQMGDECLTLMGNLIRDIMDDHSGYAVRYGGEEFLLFFNRISEYKVIMTAQKLQSILGKTPMKREGHEFFLTVSIGYALAREGMSYTDLIGVADENLYQAKAHGRDMIWPRCSA